MAEVVSNRQIPRSDVLHKFCVVHFILDNSVEVAPTKWLTDDQQFCKFPSAPPPSFYKIQTNCEAEANQEWPIWKVKIIKSYGKLY
jgi:hypothetical protein